jgi:hypothetical protein
MSGFVSSGIRDHYLQLQIQLYGHHIQGHRKEPVFLQLNNVIPEDSYLHAVWINTNLPVNVHGTSRGRPSPQGLPRTHRNTQDKQGVLITTRGRPGPEKGIRTCRRGPPGTSRGSSQTTQTRSLQGSQLRAGLQSMNFIPARDKLLPDIQSVKMCYFEIQKFPPLLE